MSTAPGMVIRASPDRLMQVFIIDDIQYTFAAVISPPIPPLQVVEAQLSYESPDDLTSTRSYQGTIEDGQLKLQFDNGPTITATVESPIDVGQVEGQGVWEQN